MQVKANLFNCGKKKQHEKQNKNTISINNKDFAEHKGNMV